MSIGCARTWRGDHQYLVAQLRPLTAVGCETVYEKEGLGEDASRLQVKAMLACLEPADILVAWKLNKSPCFRSDLLPTPAMVDAAGADFGSIIEATDTTTGRGSE